MLIAPGAASKRRRGGSAWARWAAGRDVGPHLCRVWRSRSTNGRFSNRGWSRRLLEKPSAQCDLAWHTRTVHGAGIPRGMQVQVRVNELHRERAVANR